MFYQIISPQSQYVPQMPSTWSKVKDSYEFFSTLNSSCMVFLVKRTTLPPKVVPKIWNKIALVGSQPTCKMLMYPMQRRTYLKFLLETNLGHTFRPETLHHTRTNKLPFGKSTQRMYMLVKTLSFENRFDMSPRIGLEIHILTQTSNNSIYLNQLRSLPVYRIALTMRNVPAMVRLILSTKYLD